MAVTFGSRRAHISIAAVLIVALGLASALLLHRPQAGVHRAPAAVRVQRLPAAPPVRAAPPVELKLFAPVSPTDARALNDRVPFVAGPVKPAPPFKFAGPPVDRAAAETCLAAAAYYEAGDDAEGEQAVAQVVLNRLRHPAFPKTVCGVVFEGAERRSGCQFTFTCDGALARRPSEAAWNRARDVADRALSGYVDKPVGTATHYHAAYVVPYWKASLDKLAAVAGQIYYRWHGAWGQPAALALRPAGGERLDPRLSALPGAQAVLVGGGDQLDVANAAGAALPSLSIPGVPRTALRGSLVRAMDGDAGQYVLQLASSGGASGYAEIARAICRSRADCIVMGWLRADHVPAKLPVLPARMQSMAFLYRKSSILDLAKAYWNCGQVARANRSDCLPGTAR
ncbi:MAG: cell wall hydrolase [Sphingomonadaceae bacterium]|nr:cell wall hydrolase [Sphingomonadaceae bacterium]